jgi:hypothetical protein
LLHCRALAGWLGRLGLPQGPQLLQPVTHATRPSSWWHFCGRLLLLLLLLWLLGPDLRILLDALLLLLLSWLGDGHRLLQQLLLGGLYTASLLVHFAAWVTLFAVIAVIPHLAAATAAVTFHARVICPLTLLLTAAAAAVTTGATGCPHHSAASMTWGFSCRRRRGLLFILFRWQEEVIMQQVLWRSTHQAHPAASAQKSVMVGQFVATTLNLPTFTTPCTHP